jgi:hypothetical protein
LSVSRVFTFGKLKGLPIEKGIGYRKLYFYR